MTSDTTDGEFRATHVFVRSADSNWQLASIQLSQLGAPR